MVVLNVYVGADIWCIAVGHRGRSWYVSVTSVVLCAAIWCSMPILL
jgi:hypothetical protein